MHCELLALRVLRSRLAVFDMAGQARAPRGACLMHETAFVLSQHSSTSSDTHNPDMEARYAASSARDVSRMFEISASEDVDVLSIDAGEYEDSPLHPHAYELKLNIEWPCEKQEVQKSSKLDERFLQSRSQPPHRGLPFFPDLHNELHNHLSYI